MKKLTFAVLFSTSFLVSCGNPTRLHQDGSPDGALVWPNVEDVRMDNHLGFEMDKSRFRLLRAGLSRDNLYHLLGRPHFNEGFGVREWDYLIYFTHRNERKSCLLKVLFDEDKVAQYYFWKSVSEKEDVCPPEEIFDGYYRLENDMLFAFDGSDYASLSESGRMYLYKISEEIQSRINSPSRLEIIGYSDLLGDEGYNQRLSQKRAQTVYEYLKAQGVYADEEVVIGLGEDNPRVQCDYLQGARQAKIDCLAPNRRVEIRVID